MEEHESNLRDLYAGFAMLALVMRGADEESVPVRAWDIADHMISSRHGYPEEGLAAIKKEKRHAKRKAADQDVRETPLPNV